LGTKIDCTQQLEFRGGCKPNHEAPVELNLWWLVGWYSAGYGVIVILNFTFYPDFSQDFFCGGFWFDFTINCGYFLHFGTLNALPIPLAYKMVDLVLANASALISTCPKIKRG
jgi:hypothetical protein